MAGGRRASFLPQRLSGDEEAMKRYLAVPAAVLLAAAAGAQEPPPPPIEAELAPGSRLVDARADELVHLMSDRLARATAFTLEAEEVYDEVPEQSPRRQLTGTRRAVVRRPDHFAGDVAGDALNRSFWYDGKTLSALDKEQNVWTSGAVPPTIDAALDWAFDKTGTVVPLADFVYADPYSRLMGSVQRGVYLGIHEAAGVPCYHLAFEQATIDWQLWIDAGKDPLPRKLVIAYKTEDEVPQYSVTIRKWDFEAEVPDELFRFEPPAGASRVEIPAFVGSGVEDEAASANPSPASPAKKPEQKQEKKP
jgi:hypothetical protein